MKGHLRVHLFLPMIAPMEIDPDILRSSKTHKRLMNKAVHYLGRYQASQQRLRRVLRQFAKRKFDPDKTVIERTPEEIEKAIEEVIVLCVRYGYVDDKALAAAKARSSVITGQSAYQLAGKLRLMGVDEETTNHALDNRKADHHDAEKAAAIRAMRKKRLGPYCAAYETLEFSEKQKQVAKLARLGFSVDLIRNILNYPSADDAEDALYNAEAAPDNHL